MLNHYSSKRIWLNRNYSNNSCFLHSLQLNIRFRIVVDLDAERFHGDYCEIFDSVMKVWSILIRGMYLNAHLKVNNCWKRSALLSTTQEQTKVAVTTSICVIVSKWSQIGKAISIENRTQVLDFVSRFVSALRESPKLWGNPRDSRCPDALGDWENRTSIRDEIMIIFNDSPGDYSQISLKIRLLVECHMDSDQYELIGELYGGERGCCGQTEQWKLSTDFPSAFHLNIVRR